MENSELGPVIFPVDFYSLYSIWSNIFARFVRSSAFYDSPSQGKSKWRAQTYKLETSSSLKRFLILFFLRLIFPFCSVSTGLKRLCDLSHEILSYFFFFFIVHHVSRSLWSALCNCLCHMWPCSIIQSLCYSESKVTALWARACSLTASYRHMCARKPQLLEDHTQDIHSTEFKFWPMSPSLDLRFLKQKHHACKELKLMEQWKEGRK